MDVEASGGKKTALARSLNPTANPHKTTPSKAAINEVPKGVTKSVVQGRAKSNYLRKRAQSDYRARTLIVWRRSE